MRFLIDAQLPPALAQRLTAIGHQAEHVLDVGIAAASDSAIWSHAATTGAIIISKDEDFAERVRAQKPKVQVVWIRIGNTTNTALWRKLGPRWAEIIEALQSGERLVEVA